MKKLLALLATCFVSACATVEPPLPPPIVTKVEVVKVPVPFPVPCLSVADLPKLPPPTQIDLASANERQLAAALAADYVALERYALQAEPLLRQCTALTVEKQQ